MRPLTVVADEDGVLLELGDGLDVHELGGARHDGRRAVHLLQLVRVEPRGRRVQVDHVQLEKEQERTLS